MTRSLSAGRVTQPPQQTPQKAKGVRGRLRQLLPKSSNHSHNNQQQKEAPPEQPWDAEEEGHRAAREQGKKLQSPKLRQQQQQQQLLKQLSSSPTATPTTAHGKTGKRGGRKSPASDALFAPATENATEIDEENDLIFQKQLIKERDGFCRRVSAYDGQVIEVDQVPTYELGNYLGGGVAGVVYEGHRLRPIEEYPVRTGYYDNLAPDFGGGSIGIADDTNVAIQMDLISNNKESDGIPDYADDGGALSIFCTGQRTISMEDHKPRSLKNDRTDSTGPSTTGGSSLIMRNEEEIAIEATSPTDQQVIMVDTIDAPSRSKHYAKAVASNTRSHHPTSGNHIMSRMEETVAIKILNPVGFRIMNPENTKTAVVVRKGEKMEPDAVSGRRPMEERHVWWLVNPNSRNLRTLQRYKGDRNSEVRGPRVDRGSPDKGLRISLVAAYYDDAAKCLKELPLTRCIEIWGHIPFSASDLGK